MVDQERTVVRTAIDESSDAEDRETLAATLRRLDAKAALYESYALARSGRPWAARRRAAAGLRGPGRVPVRCAALLLAPRIATRARDQRVHEPRWWLRV
jgi:hypothetical protein